MSKNEVYSWRLDTDLKCALEEAARAENTTIASLLENIVEDWLALKPSNGDDAQVQRQLQDAAARSSGSVHGGDPSRAQDARDRVRAKLKRKRAS